MSLTSAIADPQHPLACWMGARLRRTAAVRASYASTFPVRRAQRPIAAGRTVVRWDLLGVAIDFRLRCAFVEPQVPPSAVAGVAKAGDLAGAAVRRSGTTLIDAFETLLYRAGPHRRGGGWLLDDDAEAYLDRLCFALAWFDRVYRDGTIGSGSPLGASGRCGDLDSMLALVPDYAVMDLQTQVRLAVRALGALRDATQEGDCLAAPTFAGSADVGGADADLIVGRRLIEIKSIARPDVLSDRAIWQLAGYALLDYDDEYRLEEVAFYMSRIGWLASWPVEDFFGLLGCREPLRRLRADFAEQCRALAAEQAGSRIDGQHVRRTQPEAVNLDVADAQERTELT